MSTFRNDVAIDSGKTTSDCHVVCGKYSALHKGLALGAYEKDGRRHAMGKAAEYMGYKSLREEQN